MSENSLRKASNRVQILGVYLNGTPKDQLLAILEQRMDRGQKTSVLTPNPEFLVFAHTHRWFKEALNRTDLAVPDGTGLLMAAEFQNKRVGKKCPLALITLGLKVGWRGARGSPAGVLRERVAGADLMDDLCALAARRNWSVYFLGGRSGVAAAALKALQKKHPGLKGWAESGPTLTIHSQKGEWLTESRVLKGLVSRINREKPRFLFLALEMSKQARFIDDFKKELKVGLLMGVGGSFDFLAGSQVRAPLAWRRFGLEWLYRFFREPKRWRRILNAVVVFPWLVFREPSEANSVA